MGILDLLEPEEFVGAIWHRMVGDAGNAERFPEAAAEFADVERRLEIFYRGLGGGHGVELKPIADETVDFRRTRLGRLGQSSTAVTRARFDGDHLFLPQSIDVLPDFELNNQLYKWLTAWAATAGETIAPQHDDPFRQDLEFIRFAIDISNKVLTTYPGLRKIHSRLKAALLEQRLKKQLPEQEAWIEAAVRYYLGDETQKQQCSQIWEAINDQEADFSIFSAGKNYRTFLPLILWGEITPRELSDIKKDENIQDSKSASSEGRNKRTRKAKRNKSDQLNRKDPMVLARFEAVMSWAEMMNINKAMDDENEEDAQKAADDMEELSLASITRKAKTRLKFDLDLSPEDVEHERIADKYVYPEWDYRKSAYYHDHCRVLAANAPYLKEGEIWEPDGEARRRIRAVKRQFEALRPKREIHHRQPDGEEIDMDALIRARCDFKANGESSMRVFTTTRETARDLAVSVLIDVSLSSESWVEGRQVIEISKEALMALTAGLAAVGDDNAIYSFSSLRRDRVYVSTIKKFDEMLGPKVFSRIGALKPGFYTRLGTAIRHVSKELNERGNAKKLLLVLTDGKPNDLDHYEGRYGVEDSAKAVREARRAGQAVFGITIDKKAQSYFPYIFGRNAYAITRHPKDLTKALPQMYRHLVS